MLRVAQNFLWQPGRWRGGAGLPRDALEGKAPQRWPKQRLDRLPKRLGAVTGGYKCPGTCRQGDSGWAQAGRPGGGEEGWLHPFQCIPGAA